jgi:hypothetical protein
MATRVHRPLKVIAFNANGIVSQRCELSKELDDMHIDVTIFSETHSRLPLVSNRSLPEQKM